MGFVQKKGEVWRCEVCGNVVRVTKPGGGQLICCGGPMTLVKKDPPADDSRQQGDH